MQTGGLASDLARAISFMPSSFGSRKSVSSTSKLFAFEQIHRRLRVLGDINVVALLQRRAQSFARRSSRRPQSAKSVFQP